MRPHGQRNGRVGAPGQPNCGLGAGSTLELYSNPRDCNTSGAHPDVGISEKMGAR